MTDHTPKCACTVPGMVCAQHKHLPIDERPQPPMFDTFARIFAMSLENGGVERQVDEWAQNDREDH